MALGMGCSSTPSPSPELLDLANLIESYPASVEKADYVQTTTKVVDLPQERCEVEVTRDLDSDRAPALEIDCSPFDSLASASRFSIKDMSADGIKVFNHWAFRSTDRWSYQTATATTGPKADNWQEVEEATINRMYLQKAREIASKIRSDIKASKVGMKKG